MTLLIAGVEGPYLKSFGNIPIGYYNKPWTRQILNRQTSDTTDVGHDKH